MTEEFLIKLGFEKKEPYSWYGNGYDYQTPPEEGGSMTEYHDFTNKIEGQSESLIIRKEVFTWGEELKQDETWSIHCCDYYEKCHNPLPLIVKEKLVYKILNLFDLQNPK